MLLNVSSILTENPENNDFVRMNDPFAATSYRVRRRFTACVCIIF